MIDYRLALTECGVEYVDDCMRWAFGDGYGSLGVIGSHHVWNKRHSDIYVIYGTDSIVYAFKKIAELYLEHKKTS